MATNGMTKPGNCRPCGAAVYWLTNNTTQKRAPIDAEPVANGNIEIDVDHGTYRVVPRDEAETPKMAGLLRVNHFSTCVNARQHHKA